MPTDEQRMRREFEAWAEGVDLSPDFAAEREKCPDDPTHGWNYGKLTAWEAWQARDAEVQALRDALLELIECAEEASDRLKPPSGSLDFAIWNARRVLDGGETGEAE